MSPPKSHVGINLLVKGQCDWFCSRLEKTDTVASWADGTEARQSDDISGLGAIMCWGLRGAALQSVLPNQLGP
ncbi:MAG: hypothetical protein ACJASZ_001827 [Yoonia sp.]|jgi:hypothetical protein